MNRRLMAPSMGTKPARKKLKGFLTLVSYLGLKQVKKSLLPDV